MKLTPSDLMPLEEYTRQRQVFRQQVMQHKQHRQIALGEHVRLYFEDRLTIQYQIQERLQTENIVEPDGIEDALTAYNPRIPDGQNWKATLMLEYPDPVERKNALQKIIGIERKTWVQINGAERIYPVCDKDLERTGSEKAAGFHFLRFELHHDDISLLRQGAPILVGIDHPKYQVSVTLTAPQHQALVSDLD